MLFKQPLEVKVELTRKCNYHCHFCFNSNLPSTGKALPTSDAKKIIQKIASEGIEKLRFTGGEPLLHPKLPELMLFAKQQGLQVMLNTNGSLFNAKNIHKIAPCCDNVLFSLHAFDVKGESLLGGSKKGFESKIAAIKAFSGENAFTRAATILTKQNIQSLEKFAALANSLPLNQWVLLRPIPCPNNPAPINNSDVAAAVEKILAPNRGRKEKHIIENALPFCSYSPSKVSKAALGAINEDGNSKLVVNVAGEIKPSYFLDAILGNALQDSFSSAWNSPFMQRLHALEFIAEPCHRCSFLHRCRAGSRFAAFFSKGSLYALDPLAEPEKHAKDLFK